MKKLNILLTALLLAVSPLGLAACDTDEGWFEEAGEEIDEAADEIEDEFN